jgi:hypothetical protein
MADDNQPLYGVVWPLSRTIRSEFTPPARVTDLRNKRVGFLSDGLFRADEMLPAIAETLGEMFPGVSFVDHSVFGNTHAAHEKEVMERIPELLREHAVDLVISGVGA